MRKKRPSNKAAKVPALAAIAKRTPNPPPQVSRNAVSVFPLINAATAAKQIGVGYFTIYRAMERGSIKSFRIGGRYRMMRQEDFDDWVREQFNAKEVA